MSVTPERALMLAIVERAMCDATGNILGGAEYRIDEAYEWLMSEDDEPFSFVDICDEIGSDAERIRGCVIRYRSMGVKFRPSTKGKGKCINIFSGLEWDEYPYGIKEVA